jgi:dTDP-4-dehydrorhamnose 3,5-epimerase
MITIFKNKILKDKRGSLQKIYNKKIFNKTNFIPVESFFSYYSKPNVIRGIYMQTGIYCESKLITLLRGSLEWLALDLRKKSKTFLKYYFINLKRNETVYIPKGFAHGSISKKESFVYIMADKIYNNKKSVNIHWQDKDLDIEWPILKSKKIIISKMHNSYLPLSKNLKLL